MARIMKMDRILKKNWAIFFQVYRFYLGKLAKTLIMVYFLLENSLDIFLLVDDTLINCVSSFITLVKGFQEIVFFSRTF